MEITVSKKLSIAPQPLFIGENANVSDAAVSKTHISQTQGQELNQLAQRQAKEAIAEGAFEQFEAASLDTSDLPVIRSSDRPLPAKAQLLFFMAQYQGIANELEGTQRANALAVFAAQSEAQIQQARELSQRLDSLHAEFDGLEAEYVDAERLEGLAGSKMLSAEQQLAAAKQGLADILLELGVTDPDDPSIEMDPLVIEAKAKVTQAEETLALAKSEHTAARAVAEQLLGAMQNLVNKINDSTAEMNRRFGELNLGSQGNVSFTGATAHSEQALSRTAMMILLITEFIMKIEEAASDKLQNDLELNRMQTTARQAEMQRKSDEYEQQIKKAEEAQKMASCVGKILGGLAIALGAITTIFGGAGTALMAVGIALMVADPIMAAITGKSLSEMVLNPFMEHVFMPLMNIIGDIVGAILDLPPFRALLNAIDKATGFNVSDTIQTVVAAAVTIAAIVAIALVAKSAAKFMIEKMTQAMTSAIMQSIKQAISQTINKVVPQAVNNAARQSGAAISRVSQSATRVTNKVSQEISEQLDKLTQYMNNATMKVLKTNDPALIKKLGDIALNRMEMLRTGTEFTRVAFQAGMDINIAQHQLQAAKVMAEFNMASMDVQILRDLISAFLERHQQDHEVAQNMTLTIDNMIKSNTNTGAFVINNFRSI